MSSLHVAPQQGLLARLGPWLMRAALIVVGLVSLIGGLQYGPKTPEGLVGPGFVPVVAGGLILLASAWDVMVAMLEAKQHADERGEGATLEAVADSATAAGAAPAEELDAMGRTEKQRNRAVVLVFAILATMVLLVNLIGLLLSLTLMVIVLLWFIEKKKWWQALLGGALALAFGFLVFGILLEVPLPAGLLGLI
ncbi:tripartite tricarboxylate transporter TctB family protein [Luteococcus sp. OSA5]|uniref:tripartite tricarboxylate transporter TctB family protein n=1 Tax=Luteococcus sp. OSA5 TaxID=3401630 RepID=UPI003B42FB16